MSQIEFIITPYKLCVGIFIGIYGKNRNTLYPKQNGRMCLFVLDLIRQSEFGFQQLLDLIQTNCSDCIHLFHKFADSVEDLVDDNYLFEAVKHLREIVNLPPTRDESIARSSVAGIFLRKVYLFFDKMTHQTCMKFFDELMVYLSSGNIKSPTKKRRRFRQTSISSSFVSNTSGRSIGKKDIGNQSTSFTFQTPNCRTRSSLRYRQSSSQVATQNLTTAAFIGSQQEPAKKSVDDENTMQDLPTQINYLIQQQMGFLKADELKALAPKDLYECLSRPTTFGRSDATFLRYMNILRTNEFVASKQILMAYFDMVSDTVSRSYSSLNYAIWYIHHGHYKRAVECLQECFCSAQAADDEKCILISLMWLARTVTLPRQKKSLLKHIERRSSQVGMTYVQAMAAISLEQMTGLTNDKEQLKKSHKTLKEVSTTTKPQNQLFGAPVQVNPLDKDYTNPSAELLAVRNSMNDVLSMHYALVSAHLNLIDHTQSSVLASQTLLHLDMIEKCGNEDVLLINENTFIAIRNLAYHTWNDARDLSLVCEILVDLCSRLIPTHRTDHHSIWRHALAEILFESYIDQKKWKEASEMISYIKVFDIDSAQLRTAEFHEKLGCRKESIKILNGLIDRISNQENNPVMFERDLIESEDFDHDQNFCPVTDSSSFVLARALLMRARLLDTSTSIFEALSYASKKRFNRIKVCCFMLLAKHLCKIGQHKITRGILDQIIIEILANGSKTDQVEAFELLEILNTT